MSANIRLYPWFKAFQSLLFWQAIWFLYFQTELSAAEAILLYAIFDIATTALEVPSGYLSDKVGRRATLILAKIASVAGLALLAVGGGFWAFAVAQVLIGTAAALASGTDSALLYESLAAEGREDETEAHEMRAWRATFTALAVSAVAGGGMAMLWPALPFAASAITSAVALLIVLRFREPAHAAGPAPETQFTVMRRSLAHPVLLWLFGLTVVMYIFSHVPFVFGQPFIEEALEAFNLGADAPLVSGAVTATMMLLSVGTSWLGPILRQAMGLGAVLCLAFAMQVGLSGAMALSGDILIVGLLLLRMVPDSLSRPFIIARIQPLLPDHARATYLSMQSFMGRLVLAGTLIWFSSLTPDDGTLEYAQIREILVWYVGAGLVLLAGLVATLRWSGVSRQPGANDAA